MTDQDQAIAQKEKASIDELIKEMKAVALPLKAAIEDVINATEVGNVIACYDTGVEFDSVELAKEAGGFVLNGLVGALCYNVINGYTGNGAQMLNRALDQVDEAAERDASTARNEKTADTLHKRILWACRMDVQQSYRKALQDFTRKLYVAVTGERYPTRISASGKRPDSPEQKTAMNIRERIAGRSS